jgi:hypothetical protein
MLRQQRGPAAAGTDPAAPGQHSGRQVTRQHSGRQVTRQHNGRQVTRQHSGRQVTRQHSGRQVTGITADAGGDQEVGAGLLVTISQLRIPRALPPPQPPAPPPPRLTSHSSMQPQW